MIYTDCHGLTKATTLGHSKALESSKHMYSINYIYMYGLIIMIIICRTVCILRIIGDFLYVEKIQMPKSCIINFIFSGVVKKKNKEDFCSYFSDVQ